MRQSHGPECTSRLPAILFRIETPPSFDIAEPEEPRAPERRAPFAWVGLSALFLLLIVSALITLYDRQPGDLPSMLKHEMAVRQAVTLQPIVRQTSPPGADPRKASALQDLFRELGQEASTNPPAGLLRVAAKHELGFDVEPEDLALVATTDTAKQEAFRDIYSSEKLSLERARELAAKVTGNRLADRMARAHALRKAGDASLHQALFPPWKGYALIAIGLVGTGLIFTGLGLWALYIAARRDGKLKPIGHPAEPLTPGHADHFAARVLLALLAFVLLISSFGSFIGQRVGHLAGQIAASMMMIGVIVLIYARWTPTATVTFERIGVTRANLGRNVLWGLAGFAANVPVLIVGAIIASQLTRFFPQPSHPAVEMLMGERNIATVLTLLFLASITAPIWEEIVFRGTLLPALSRVTGSSVYGVVLASFLFAAIHPQGPAAWPALALVGAMAAMLTYQTRSLVPAITMHAVHNFGTLLLGITIF